MSRYLDMMGLHHRVVEKGVHVGPADRQLLRQLSHCSRPRNRARRRVSAFFHLIGWGGEWASQTAGAASGAAPLIIDGIRQRRRRDPRADLNALRQAGFYARIYLHRLPAEDRDTALALLDEAAAARRG